MGIHDESCQTGIVSVRLISAIRVKAALLARNSSGDFCEIKSPFMEESPI